MYTKIIIENQYQFSLKWKKFIHTVRAEEYVYSPDFDD